MAAGEARRPVAWGQLALATLLASVAFAYLVEARGVSRSADNLLLLQPTAIIVLVLYAIVALGCLRGGTAMVAETRAELLRTLAMVGAFGLFILGLEGVGYDLAILVFTAAGIFICGERKALPLLLIPPIFTVVVIYGFRAMVPYPFPTLVL